jgi:hypothetical protein
MLVEVLLQLFICKIDAKLLKVVLLELLETCGGSNGSRDQQQSGLVAIS